MSDALVSPLVGAAMWSIAAGSVALSVRRLRRADDEQRVPLMGVMGAFVFAAEMVNFAIPATGSSGHLGGGLLLAIVLGPHAALVVMASVLAVQALLFADGGLLALGCNIVNLALVPCFVAYPLVFRPIAGRAPTRRRLVAGSILTAVVGLALGAFAVVLQTLLSGITALPFGTFVLLMQPIHLAIGLVEGVATAAVGAFVLRARPELLAERADAPHAERADPAPRTPRPTLVGLAVAALLVGGVLGWFASPDPDGLEWATARTARRALAPATDRAHRLLAVIQRRTALLPDYALPSSRPDPQRVDRPSPRWPAVEPGTSLSAVVGSALTLCVAVGLGAIIKRKRRRRTPT